MGNFAANTILSVVNGFMNLNGGYNYILMYLNDIEYIYTNTNLDNAFAKILLSGNPGDILFNTFISQPLDLYSKTYYYGKSTRSTYNQRRRISYIRW